MLILNPRNVRFGSTTWPDVTLVAIDRDAARLALEWSDLGPHPVFADAPEQRLTIRIIQDAPSDDIDAPRPGDHDTLTLYTSPTAADARRRKLTAAAVITSITHELSQTRPHQRRITLTALSADGATAPITVSDPVLGEI